MRGDGSGIIRGGPSGGVAFNRSDYYYETMYKLIQEVFVASAQDNHDRMYRATKSLYLYTKHFFLKDKEYKEAIEDALNGVYEANKRIVRGSTSEMQESIRAEHKIIMNKLEDIIDTIFSLIHKYGLFVFGAHSDDRPVAVKSVEY